MAFVISSIITAILEMDHIGTEVVGENTIYKFKTTSISPSLTEFKCKVLSVLDFPIDIPKNVEIREVKRGKLFKEYVVDITVPTRKIGKVSDLLAKKYGIVRRRPYSGEIGV